MVAIYLDPTNPSQFAETGKALLFAYLLHSIAALLVLLTTAQLGGRYLAWVTLVDLFWPVVISMFTAASNSPFYLFSLFAVTTVSYRWQLLTAVLAAVVSSAAVFLEALAAKYLHLPNLELDLNSTIMRAAYLLIMGVVVAYFADREKELHREAVKITRLARLARPEVGLAECVAAVLLALSKMFSARLVLAAIKHADTGRAYLCMPSDSGPNAPLQVEPLNVTEASESLLEHPQAVTRGRKRQGTVDLFTITAGESELPIETLSAPTPDFLRSYLRKRFLCAAINVQAEWRGAVYLVDPPWLQCSEAKMRFLGAIVSQVASRLYNVAMLQQSRSQVAELERSRLASEIHDGVLPSLSAIDMNLWAMVKTLPSDVADFAPRLNEMRDLAQKCIIEVRQVLHGLVPERVTATTFLENLRNTVTRFRDTGMYTEFLSELDEMKVAPETAHHIGKIVQEALVNARKHGRAHGVRVAIARAGSAYKLTITDDGKGFSFSGRRTRFQLAEEPDCPKVLVNRVRAIGGDLCVESSPGRGATVEISIPADEELTYA